MKTGNRFCSGVLRLLSSFILLTSLLVLPKVQAKVGDTFTDANFKYTVLTEEGTSGTVSVTKQSYTVPSGAVTIPRSVTQGLVTYSVTRFGYQAFYKCSNLTSIKIPDSVTNIGERAFNGCDSLTSVVIGNGVTSIGYLAFAGCTGLTSVVIGNSVTSIGTGAFSNCSSLTSITIPDSVTSIWNIAFQNCSSLTSAVIGNSVTSIGNNAFSNCSSLTSITIPDSVTSIGDYGFYKCSSLTSAVIGNSVTSIGHSAFLNCSSLTSITIPDSVTSIGHSAFLNCSSLASVVIGNGVTHIEHNAFSGCTGLTSVVIGNSVTHIEESAFRGCSSLTSITIPDSVTNIGIHAFQSCISLTSVVIGNSVTSIGDYAFDGCSSLTSITIPDSVTNIGYMAFYHCYIKEINFLGERPYIGGDAFGSTPHGYYIEGMKGWPPTVCYDPSSGRWYGNDDGKTFGTIYLSPLTPIKDLDTPIVLIHGWSASSETWDNMVRLLVEDAARETGFTLQYVKSHKSYLPDYVLKEGIVDETKLAEWNKLCETWKEKNIFTPDYQTNWASIYGNTKTIQEVAEGITTDVKNRFAPEDHWGTDQTGKRRDGKFDLVTHSTGGNIALCMAFQGAKIRNFIPIACPFYGQYFEGFNPFQLSFISSTMASQQTYGSSFLWDITQEWQRLKDKPDTLSIIGYTDSDGWDNLVHHWSAALDVNNQYVARKHSSYWLTQRKGEPGICDCLGPDEEEKTEDDAQDAVYILVRNFLFEKQADFGDGSGLLTPTLEGGTLFMQVVKNDSKDPLPYDGDIVKYLLNGTGEEIDIKVYHGKGGDDDADYINSETRGIELVSANSSDMRIPEGSYSLRLNASKDGEYPEYGWINDVEISGGRTTMLSFTPGFFVIQASQMEDAKVGIYNSKGNQCISGIIRNGVFCFGRHLEFRQKKENGEIIDVFSIVIKKGEGTYKSGRFIYQNDQTKLIYVPDVSIEKEMDSWLIELFSCANTSVHSITFWPDGVPGVPLRIGRSSGDYQIPFPGTLEESPDGMSNWTEVEGAVSPYTMEIKGKKKFYRYRVRVQGD